MKRVELTLPEIGVLAATRGMLGLGAGFLLSTRISSRKRRAVGWPLLAIGVASTIPLVMDFARKIKSE